MVCWDKYPELKADVSEYYQKQLENMAVKFRVNQATSRLEIDDPNGNERKDGMNDSCILAGITITPGIAAALAAQGLNPQDLQTEQMNHNHGHA